MTAYVIALLACFALSAFFSASEMALSAANRLRLENAAEDGDRRARTALGLIDRFDTALGAILIGNNLVNVAASSLSSVIALAVAAAVQCPYCIDAYTNTCLQQGCDEAEIAEAFHVTNAIRGGAALAHGVQALKIIQEQEL